MQYAMEVVQVVARCSKTMTTCHVDKQKNNTK